ncbi:MAG: 6-phosphofructokinase [Clostridiales bacterium]|nr:6-phosphofructokinase [Clostridiales bacterium]
MMRVGILTSGGDCQGLNAAIRGVAKALYESYDEIEIYGIRDGYRGLIGEDYRLMKPEDFSGILTLGGTILGTSRQPFKRMRVIEENSVDKVAAMKKTVARLCLDCLVIMGGNGTHKTANLLREEGVPVVTLPKTIDNDLWGTDVTFGFQSAVDIGAQVIDCIHTTATSHSRVFIVELMGHKVGWLALHAGMAGGADVILLPELPYDISRVGAALEKRRRQGKAFSILAVAEGALSRREAKMGKKELAAFREASGKPSVAYRLAEELEPYADGEVRVCVPGHFQRGGPPCPFDRVLATQLGAAAAGFIREQRFGVMCAMVNGSLVPVKLENVAGKLKKVPEDSAAIQLARDTGVSFGI